MEYYKFIYDEEQIRKFVSILSPLKSEEVYFVSMSARNKYLNEEERRIYDLGRTEMFARKLVKYDKNIPIEDVYLRVLKSLQVSYGGYTSRSGKNIPEKCLVAYANINPSSGIKALKKFQMEVTEMLFDMRTNTDTAVFFSHLDSKLLNHFQRERGTRTLIDVDFDIPEEGKPILVNFINKISEKGVKYHIIKTRSGFHVLLEKNTIKFNYNEYIFEANKQAQEEFGKEHVEVVLNKNEMVPVPGTMQAGFKVKFIEDLI